MKKFAALLHARNMEFLRDRGTLFWNILFPFFMVFGFAFAFSGDQGAKYKIGIVGPVDESVAFMDIRYVDFVPYDDLAQARTKVRHHQLDLLIDFNTRGYYIGAESVNSYVAEKLFLADGGEVFTKNELKGRAIRYVDWFVPGVIGMNMMFSCMFGVGFVIVRYRKNGVLKRMKATPVRPLEFVSAHIVSRLLIAIVTSVFVYVGSNLFLDFMMLGSYFDLLLVLVLSIISLISFGMVFSARIRSEELASGLINMAIWPMIIFSGVFFSMEGTPEILQQFAKVFPLCHFITATRAIMLDGATLGQVWPQIGFLLGLTAVFTAVASALFRWE